jgi:hypothetical protein
MLLLTIDAFISAQNLNTGPRHSSPLYQLIE